MVIKTATNAEMVLLFRASNQTERAMREVVTGLNRIEGGINGVLGTAAKLGTVVTAIDAAAGAIAGAVGSVSSTVLRASDTAEAMSRIEVVFGDAAGAIAAFADTADTALGISRLAALNATGTFGNLFTAMEIGPEVAAGMSTTLVQLASDLASFNNIPVGDALEKLRAGLVGETEPLRTLGVNLNAAQIEAKALELGLIEVGQELSAAARAQAAYALIFAQTAAAQGDFVRTSNGLANQLRILEASFETLKATAGEALLPLATAGVQNLNTFLAATRNFQREGLDVLSAALQSARDRLEQAFGPDVARAFEQVTQTIGDFFSGLGTQIRRFEAGGFDQLWTDLQDSAERAAAGLGQVFSAWIGPATLDLVDHKLPLLLEALGRFIQHVGPQLAERAEIWGEALSHWVTTTALPEVIKRLVQLAEGVGRWAATDGALAFLTVGLRLAEGLLKGFATGMAEGAQAVLNSIQHLFTGAAPTEEGPPDISKQVADFLAARAAGRGPQEPGGAGGGGLSPEMEAWLASVTTPAPARAPFQIQLPDFSDIIARFTGGLGITPPGRGGGGGGGGGGGLGDRFARELEPARRAIDGFMAELARDTPRWERAFGELGSRAAQSLVDALASDTEAGGTAVARALQELVQEAERSGVPNFQDLADELAGSLHDALLERGNPAMRDAALENLGAFLETIRQANALTTASFGRALDLAAAADQVGAGGRQVMESLRRAIEDGGAQNIRALADAAIGMRRQLFEDRELSPERAAAVWASVWDAINTAIEDGSAEAQENLRQFFSDLDFALRTEKLGAALGERINVAIQDTEEAITKAAENAATQIEEARQRIIEARDIRAARENVTAVQAEELRGVEAQIEQARQNWQRFREDQEVDRRRAREDSELAIGQARELEDLERRRAQQLADTRRQNQPGGTPVGGLGTQAERRGGVDELRARFRQEDEERVRQQARQDADRERRRGQEDADLQRRRREAEVDRREAETQALLLRQFRETQARNLQTFLDLQEDQGLARQENRITVEAQKAIDEANRRLTETRTAAEREHAADLARITALQGAMGTAADPFLADLVEARRQIETLPKPWATETTPGPLEQQLPNPYRNVPKEGGAGVGAGPMVTINVAGHVVGVDDLLGLIDRGLANRVESVTAVGGY